LLDGTGDLYVKNAAEVRKVLEESGKVLAVFQGHHHPGQYHEIDGIHYYTLKAVLEDHGEENNAYAIVDVQPDRNVIVTGFRRAETRRLTFVPTATHSSKP
jgi:alkaline phosphatase